MNIEEAVTVVKTMFQDLITQGRDIFKSKKVKPVDIKAHLIGMCSVQSSSNKKVIDTLLKHNNTVDGIFDGIGYYGFWNYMNYVLFEDMVAELLQSQPDDLLTESIKGYRAMFEKNVLSMCLVNICQKVKFPLQKVDAKMEKYFTQWTLTLNVETNELEMRFVDNLRYSLAIEFEVPLPMILLFNLELANSSLEITWLIPESFQMQIATKIQSCLQLLKYTGVLIMKIGESVCYKVNILGHARLHLQFL